MKNKLLYFMLIVPMALFMIYGVVASATGSWTSAVVAVEEMYSEELKKSNEKNENLGEGQIYRRVSAKLWQRWYNLKHLPSVVQNLDDRIKELEEFLGPQYAEMSKWEGGKFPKGLSQKLNYIGRAMRRLRQYEGWDNKIKSKLDELKLKYENLVEAHNDNYDIAMGYLQDLQNLRTSLTSELNELKQEETDLLFQLDEARRQRDARPTQKELDDEKTKNIQLQTDLDTERRKPAPAPVKEEKVVVKEKVVYRDKVKEVDKVVSNKAERIAVIVLGSLLGIVFVVLLITVAYYNKNYLKRWRGGRRKKEHPGEWVKKNL